MKFSAMGEVYANLIMIGRKTEEQVPAIIRTEVMIIVCAKHINAKEITLNAVYGIEPDVSDEKYKDHKYLGFARDAEVKKALIQYMTPTAVNKI